MSHSFSPPAPWRTLPPAGAPLPMSSLVRSLQAFVKPQEVEQALQVELRHIFGAEHAILTDSGRSGLALALKALQACVPPEQKEQRTEILIPAYVSYSVPSAVVHAGFKVRLYDVTPSTLSPNYTSMQAHASEKTLAIVVCHQFGFAFDCAEAQKIATACGAFLVDDAAQVMGAKVGSSHAGCMADVGLFSLSRGKPLTAVEGGIVLTKHAHIATAMESTAKQWYFGATPSKGHDLGILIKALALFILRRPLFYTLPASLPWLNIGASIFEPNFPDGALSPYRMALCKAALGLLEKANAQRCQWAKQYTQLIENQKELCAISPMSQSNPMYLRYPVLPTAGAEKYIQQILTHQKGSTAKKLGISRGFPQALCAVSELKPHLAHPEENVEKDFSGAGYLAANLITLPTHDQVQPKDVTAMAQFFTAISADSSCI